MNGGLACMGAVTREMENTCGEESPGRESCADLMGPLRAYEMHELIARAGAWCPCLDRH